MSNISVFRGTIQETVFCLACLKALMGNSTLSMFGHHRQQRRDQQLVGAPEKLQYCRQTPEGQEIKRS